jgi:Membrane bound beta barrel domain (DUF5777)
MPRAILLTWTLVCVSLILCSSAAAQQPETPKPAQAPASAPPSAPVAAADGEQATTPAPDAPPVVSREIDQTLINLPTTLPLKRHHSSFRITHRFARDLRLGSFGNLAEDLFSLDNGAVIGLEYRFGITDRIQGGVNRSILGKTIETFGRWDAWRQTDNHPFGLSAMVSLEGQNNLHVDPQPGIGVTVSHTHGPLAVYATPTFIKDAHTPTLRVSHEGHEHTAGSDDPDASAHEDQNNTAFIGLGARLRIRPTVSVVGEVSPRVYGYRPDRAAWGAGIEKLTHGHVLQLNFGNSFGTTAGQVARGGSPHDVYMGFNLSRKF